jgi:hypothetical protein
MSQLHLFVGLTLLTIGVLLACLIYLQVLLYQGLAREKSLKASFDEMHAAFKGMEAVNKRYQTELAERISAVETRLAPPSQEFPEVPYPDLPNNTSKRPSA